MEVMVRWRFCAQSTRGYLAWHVSGNNIQTITAKPALDIQPVSRRMKRLSHWPLTKDTRAIFMTKLVQLPHLQQG